jgi:hypothetical protein
MNYVAAALERHGVPYAVTGSHASNVFGETRFRSGNRFFLRLHESAQAHSLENPFEALEKL